MPDRDHTITPVLDWAPMLAQLEALAEHIRALSDAPTDGDREEGTPVTDPADLREGDRVSFTYYGDLEEGVLFTCEQYAGGEHLCTINGGALVRNSSGMFAHGVSDVRLLSRAENTPPASQNAQDARTPSQAPVGPPDASEAHSGDSGPRLFVAPDYGYPMIWWGTDRGAAERVLWRRWRRPDLADAFDALAALIEADQAGRVAGPGQVVVDPLPNSNWADPYAWRCEADFIELHSAAAAELCRRFAVALERAEAADD